MIDLDESAAVDVALRVGFGLGAFVALVFVAKGAAAIMRAQRNELRAEAQAERAEHDASHAWMRVRELEQKLEGKSA